MTPTPLDPPGFELELSLVHRDGTITQFKHDPDVVWEVLEGMDPAYHRRLTAVGDGLVANVWPLVHAPHPLARACIRVDIGGEVRWLGRLAVGPELELDGHRVPACAAVPLVWVAGAIRCLAQGPRYPLNSLGQGFPLGLPWHREEKFVPVGEWRADAFSFEALCSAGDRLPDKLHELRASLLHLIRTADDPSKAMDESIAELSRVGYEIYSWDYDGSDHTWGYDYGQPAPSRSLWLSFRLFDERRVDLRFADVEFVTPEDDG